MSKISVVHARQILDSRGNPTVEVDVTLNNGAFGRASVPSGASTGSHEAIELRDHQPDDYLGQSVHTAVTHINTEIAAFLMNNDPSDQFGIDNEMILRDGPTNTSRLGANAVLGVSLAISKAVAADLDVPYYRYVSRLYGRLLNLGSQPNDAASESTPATVTLPRPMFNVLNGGAHTNWESTDIQEFMIIPIKPGSFTDQLQMCTEIYHTLEKVLAEKGYSTTVGDEGGFAPAVKTNQAAIELILAATEKAGYRPGIDIGLGIDAAMSEMYQNGKYELRSESKKMSAEQMITMWQEWARQYPLISLEDGLAEDDWTSWQVLTTELGGKLQIVGDDLLVTNLERIQKAIQMKACNSLLMKVNQIGTLTESLQAIVLAKKAGWSVIVSHRSGETEDTSIADIVVGTNAGQIKAGAPARSERLAKYNQLLRIEEELASQKN